MTAAAQQSSISHRFDGEFLAAMELGWHDFVATYRRSFLGPIWLPLQTLVFVIIITLVLGRSFENDSGLYATYVALGLLAWELISGALMEAPRLFAERAGLIKNIPMKLSLLAVRKLVYLLCRVAFIIPLAAIIVALFGKPVGWTALWVLPAIPLLILSAYSVLTIAGFIGVYLRDFHFMMQTILRFLFFMTPIFWYGDQGARSIVARYNPFTYFIEVIRSPIMGTAPSTLAWCVVLSVTVVGLALSALILARFRRAIVFWL